MRDRPPALIVGAEDGVVANLLRHAHQARGAYATNTERALRADVLIFTGWCASQQLTWQPAAPDTVAAFIDAMGVDRAPATIRRYVSSIASLHRAAGFASPCDAAAVRLALKRLHRDKGRAQKQAAPLNRRLIDRMLDLPVRGPRDLRNRALLATAYDTLCRRAELVALDFLDIEFAADGSGVAKIRRSKTDQEGAGDLRYLAADTMAHLQAWICAAGLAAGPLFRSVGKAGAIRGPIDAGDVARIFKQMALAAGASPEVVAQISGHSSRVGAAQDMVMANVDMPALMQSGGWASSVMPARYTAKIAARRSGAAKLAERQGRA